MISMKHINIIKYQVLPCLEIDCACVTMNERGSNGSKESRSHSDGQNQIFQNFQVIPGTFRHGESIDIINSKMIHGKTFFARG
jgi:hypothetical protein